MDSVVLLKMTKKRKVIIFIILAALAGGGFLIWRRRSQNSQAPTYSTAQVERGTIVSTVSASGNLLQTNTFTVTTSVTGVVKDVLVKDGQEVAKDEPLVEIVLDQSSEQARVKAWSAYLSAKDAVTSAEQSKLTLEKGVRDAESKLITAQEDFNGDWGSTEYWDAERRKRWSDLKSTEISLTIAQQKYARADEAITKAQADLNSAWLSYQEASSVIKAPQAGKVSGILVAPGMALSSSASTTQTGGSQKLLTLIAEQRPLLSVSINEIDIGKIAADQKVTITFDSLPDKTFTGKVVGVDRTGSATQGVVSYPVLIQLDTGAEQVYTNMSATAEIIIESKENVLWVPPAALRTQAGQTSVRVLAPLEAVPLTGLVNGQPQEKTVEVGLETSDRAEITSGLSEGETVVVSEQTTTTGGQAPAFGGGGGMRMMMR